jgi:hypothetical protein
MSHDTYRMQIEHVSVCRACHIDRCMYEIQVKSKQSFVQSQWVARLMESIEQTNTDRVYVLHVSIVWCVRSMVMCSTAYRFHCRHHCFDCR